MWFSLEYLLWWSRKFDTPPLVTTGPPGSLAVIGNPGTTVLVDRDSIDNTERHGIRMTFGVWFTQYQECGLEVSSFLLGSRATGFNAISNGGFGSSDIAIPFLDVGPGLALAFENSIPVAVTGLSSGIVNVNTHSRLWGGEGNFILNMCCNERARVDLLLGFRYLDLGEGIGIITDSTVLPAVPFIGRSSLVTSDTFSADNRFYGGQIGARGEWWWNRLTTSITGKLAIGGTHEIANIAGVSQFTSPVSRPLIFSSGNLALPSNIGRHSRTQLGIVPEFAINVGYNITRCLKIQAGYSYLFWDNVLRPGDIIDRAVNPTTLPLLGAGNLVGPTRPAFSFNDKDFWVHGLNVGAELRF